MEKYNTKSKREEISFIVKKLDDLIPSYTGVHSDILIHATSILELFSSLLEETDFSDEEKELVRLAVKYSTTLEDAIPLNEYGAYGFIDDLYLLSYTIKILSENGRREIIEWYWDEDTNIFSLVSKIIKDIENSPDENIRKTIPQILSYIGLKNQKDITEKDFTEYQPAIRETSKKDVDTIIQEAKDICEDLRASALKRNEIADSRVECSVDPSLLQEQIPTHLIFHICRKAKFNDLLSPKQRGDLFQIARKKMKGWRLSTKQVQYLEDLIEKAIKLDVDTLPCEDEPCEKCEELKDLLKKIKGEEI